MSEEQRWPMLPALEELQVHWGQSGSATAKCDKPPMWSNGFGSKEREPLALAG